MQAPTPPFPSYMYYIVLSDASTHPTLPTPLQCSTITVSSVYGLSMAYLLCLRLGFGRCLAGYAHCLVGHADCHTHSLAELQKGNSRATLGLHTVTQGQPWEVISLTCCASAAVLRRRPQVKGGPSPARCCHCTKVSRTRCLKPGSILPSHTWQETPPGHRRTALPQYCL